MTNGSGHAPLEMEYNHDLKVSDCFLSLYPAIRDALYDQRLVKLFDFFEDTAKANKRAFQKFGTFSLSLGLVPLVLSAVRMAVGEVMFARIADLNVIAELCGVAAVGLMYWSRHKRHRLIWCEAVFWRERLRQWHFQKFLDGRLVSLLVSERQVYDLEIGKRWAKLQESIKDGDGAMVDFINMSSPRSDFLHEPAAYSEPRIAADVCEALWTLRFEHQLRFSRRKVQPEGDQSGFSLEERISASETVASVSLAGAICMSVLAFAVSGAHIFALHSWMPWDAAAMTRVLGGIALLLAVFSAASRAYRAGFSLPDESESYEEYCDRVRELKAVFQNVSGIDKKLDLLRQLEEEAAAELRRFLRMKSRATFIS